MKSNISKISLILWILALIITAFSAYYQRITGPSYPLEGSTIFQGTEVNYSFEQSCSTNEDCPVSIKVADTNVTGTLLWKRYKTNDELSRADMKNNNNLLTADLPKQPPAGKLQYFVRVTDGKKETLIPQEPVVVRFRGDIPLYILILHIIIMFAAMLLSTRAGLEIFRKEPNLKFYAFWTLGLLTIGGLILGPIVQNYAFGEYWTGIPFGFDLTDNKTLIAWIVWLVAIIMIFKSKRPKVWVLGAAIFTIIIFLIPHSLMGSELDYSKMK
jgi:hypothetical protein